MKTSHLLFALGQLFKEERLAFKRKPTGAPSGAPASAPAQRQAPAAAPAAAPQETPQKIKGKTTEEIKKLKRKLRDIIDNPDQYTEGLVKIAKEINTNLGAIEQEIDKKVDKKEADSALAAAHVKKILPDRSMAIGTFDLGTGKLTEGKITHPDGEIEEGKFDKNTGKLTEGKITFPNGLVYIYDGKEWMQQWEQAPAALVVPATPVILRDGSIAIGTFDPGTGKLTEGKITHPDGEIEEGKFDKNTDKLIEGKVTFPNGLVYIYDGKEWMQQW